MNLIPKKLCIFPWFILFMALCSCSLLDARRKKESGPKQLDVPMSARPKGYIRRRVLVLPIINLSTYAFPGVEEIAEKELVQTLSATGEVLVLDPKKLAEDLRTFQANDTYDMDKVLPLAKKIGAHSVIVGRIQDLSTRKIGDSVGVFRKIRAEVKTTIDLQMISTKNASSMVNEIKSAELQEDITRVAKYSYTDRELYDNPELVKKVVSAAFGKVIFPVLRALRKFSWEGRVALIRGERLFLNAGRMSGLQMGDILRVSDGREKVFDPVTGKYIGKIRGRMKGTLEVISYFGKDGSVTVVHSGSGFEPGDVVEFY